MEADYSYIVNIILIAWMVISFIFGIVKGFRKINLTAFSLIISFSMAYLITIPLTRFFMFTTIGSETLSGFFTERLLTLNSATAEELASTQAARESQIYTVLAAQDYPSFVIGLIIANVTTVSGTIENAIGCSMAYMLLFVIIYLVLFFTIFIDLKSILKTRWEDEESKSVFKTGDKGIPGRIFSGFYCLSLNMIFIFACFLLLSFFSEAMVMTKQTTLYDNIVKILYLDKNGNSLSIAHSFYMTAQSFTKWVSLL